MSSQESILEMQSSSASAPPTGSAGAAFGSSAVALSVAVPNSLGPNARSFKSEISPAKIIGSSSSSGSSNSNYNFYIGGSSNCGGSNFFPEAICEV